MKNIGLGRLVAKDDRDGAYMMPRRAAEAASVDQQYWITPPAYDQGATSQCVAYSGVRYLVSSPVRNLALGFRELYLECQGLDEWEHQSEDDGTSVRALFKAFKNRGLVSEYLWAFTVEPVINHLLTVGPVVVGTVWTEEMANIGKSGYITLGDVTSELGGHAWCLVGANRHKENPDGTTGAVRAMNSWGAGWGPHKGRFWVTFKDLETLIKLDGEACVAKEVRL